MFKLKTPKTAYGFGILYIIITIFFCTTLLLSTAYLIKKDNDFKKIKTQTIDRTVSAEALGLKQDYEMISNKNYISAEKFIEKPRDTFVNLNEYYNLPPKLSYTKKDKWQVLTSPNGFSFDIPTSWNLDITRTIDGDIRCGDLQNLSEIVHINTVGINLGQFLQEKNFKDIAEKVKSHEQKGVYTQLVSEQNITINGLTGIYIATFTNLSWDRKSYLHQLIYLKKGDSIVSIALLTKEVNYKQNKDDLIAIIASIR